jgi:hypothetical protein
MATWTFTTAAGRDPGKTGREIYSMMSKGYPVAAVYKKTHP